MKLLAVVAIGVIACLGTPVLAKKYRSIENDCGIIKHRVDRAWYWWKDYLHFRDKASDELFDSKLPPHSKRFKELDSEIDHYNEKLDYTIRKIAHFAQVYSTFCK